VKDAFLVTLAQNVELQRLPVSTAAIYAALGQHSQALEWLEKAYAMRHGELIWLNVSPALDSLRAEPRFVDIVRRIGL
jgi:hypothetical protein